MSEVIFDFSNQQQAIEADEELLRVLHAAAESVLAHEGLEGVFEISLSLVDKPEIQRLNAAYRGINKVTDVLSFPLAEDGNFPQNPGTGAKLLGDIVICTARALEQALEYGHSNEREFAFLCAHSVLHLLGYDHVGDAEQARQMEQKQEQALADIGLTR